MSNISVPIEQKETMKGIMMGKVLRQTGVIIGGLLLLIQTGTAQTTKEYIDVHVHLRGTTKSGMLGNTSQGKKMHGHMHGRESLSAMGLQFEAGQRGHSQRDPKLFKEENLQIAAKNMIKKMDQYGVQQALVVVVPGPNPNGDEYASMRRVVAEYPDRLKLMAGGAMLSPYLKDMAPEKVTDTDRSRFRQIATQVLRDGGVGFGEMISYHLSMADYHSFQYAPPDHPHFLLLADISAQHKVPIDLHMEAIVTRRPMPDNLRRASTKNPGSLEPTIPAFERLLAHNRKARIVWQHIGWDNTGDMTAELVDQLMSTHPNLFIALRVERRTHQVGNGPPMPNRLVNRRGELKREWLALIKKFQDRVTIGSDEFFFPVESRRPNQSFAETWALLDQLTPSLAQKIGRDNPRRIYSLE
jgi:hypothetical protein